jgi:hypothetical protein
MTGVLLAAGLIAAAWSMSIAQRFRQANPQVASRARLFGWGYPVALAKQAKIIQGLITKCACEGSQREPLGRRPATLSSLPGMLFSK